MVDNLINIPSYKQEANYRYKMPKMQLHLEGKGKNTRTNITNMIDVAKALNVNTIYPLKFIELQCGTRSIYEKSE